MSKSFEVPSAWLHGDLQFQVEVLMDCDAA